MTPAGAPDLDIALALRRILQGFWADFAPIVLLGFGAVTLPSLARALVADASHAGTVLAVVRGLGAALFVTVVSHGVVARLRGHPLDAGGFISHGLARSPPGFSVALLLGAALVTAAIAALLAGRAWPPLVWGLAAAGAVLALRFVPAVPLAIAEHLGPLPALHRAATLTRGQRGRLAVLVAVLLFSFGPAWLLLDGLVRGIETGAAPTLASPGLWLRTLFELVAWSVAAVVPGVVYAGLATARRNSR